MKKPKITIEINEAGFSDGGAQILEIQKKGELGEYGFEYELDANFKKVKPGDVILFSHTDFNVFCAVRFAATFSSGKQRIGLKYHKVERKES